MAVLFQAGGGSEDKDWEVQYGSIQSSSMIMEGGRQRINEMSLDLVDRNISNCKGGWAEPGLVLHEVANTASLSMSLFKSFFFSFPVYSPSVLSTCHINWLPDEYPAAACLSACLSGVLASLSPSSESVCLWLWLFLLYYRYICYSSFIISANYLHVYLKLYLYEKKKMKKPGK